MSCQKHEEKEVSGHGDVSDSKEEEIRHLAERRRSQEATKITLHSIPMRVIKEYEIMEPSTYSCVDAHVHVLNSKMPFGILLLHL